jgi:methylated-DNA-[protein]-cysteine S-methyltransferase
LHDDATLLTPDGLLFTMPACLSFASPIGRLAVRASAEAVVEVSFDGTCTGDSGTGDTPSALCVQARDEIQAYLAGRRIEFTVPVTPRGTPFQQEVWRLMGEIPYGETRTYGDLAAATGEPGAGQAVGLACGANPIPLVIPCHRVVASNGLGGFGGGVDRKRWLLDLERGQRRLRL